MIGLRLKYFQCFQIGLAIGLFILPCFKSYAQSEEIASIKVIGRSFGDSVVLRWAPTSPTAWQALNLYGYKIERYTLVRDSIALQDKPMKVLVNGLKPAELIVWTPLG